MIYSVWNQGARSYDYYENGDVQKSANTPIPSHISSPMLGATIDQAAWPLPPNAVKVGSGEFAKGRVASRGGNLLSMGAFSMDTNTVAMIGLGVAAYFLWKSGFLKA